MGHAVTLSLVLGMLSLASVAVAGDSIVSAGLGVEFATGDYGTGLTTDSVTVPLIIDIYPVKRLEFEVVIPYLYQSNSATVSAGGVRFRRNVFGSSGGTYLGYGLNGNGLSSAAFLAALAANDASRSQTGLGNISIKGAYTVLEEGPVVPQVKPVVYVEFPTADKDKGLGTGEFVTGLGASVMKWFDRWRVFGEGRYNFQGSSDLYALKDFFSFEVGGGYQATDRLLTDLSLLGATKPADGASEMLEARGKVAYRLSAKGSVEGYLAAGLATGSPDFGVGLAVFYDF